MNNEVKQQLTHYLKHHQITQDELKNILYPLSIKTSNYKDFLNGEKWVNALGTNILHNTEIFIIGDYDADGVLSATVVNQALRVLLKSSYDNKIHMLERTRLEGYGLHVSDLDRIDTYLTKQKKDNATIIILDNGVSTYKEFDYLNQKLAPHNINYTVLVADHHEQNDKDDYEQHYQKKFQTPPSVKPIIVDPFLKEENPHTYKELSATGLSYVLMMGLNEWIKNFKQQNSKIKDKSTNMTSIISDLLKTYVGISLMTDSCKLLGENRYYVTFAINYLNKYHQQGFQDNINPLISFCHEIETTQNIYTIDEKFFGWTLGPIINAVSRMNGSCKIAQDIFNITDENIRHNKIQKAIELNNQRKTTVNNLSNQLIEKLNNQDTSNAIIINLATYLPEMNWSKYPGLIGLIANNIMTTFQVPTLLLAPNRLNSALTGSARTPEYSQLFHAMFTVKKDFDLDFGGHQEAFGVSWLPFKQLNDFIKETNKVLIDLNNTSHQTNDNNNSLIEQSYDYTINEFSSTLYQYLQELSPFGQSFEEPSFFVNIPLNQLNIEYIGANEQHAKIIFKDKVLMDWNNAITWENLLANHSQDSVDVYTNANLHEWNGQSDFQFIINHIKLKKKPITSLSPDLELPF